MGVHRFVLEGEHEPERIDKLLARLLPNVSRAAIQRWMREGRVTLDGLPCRASDRSRPGATLEVTPGPPPPSDVEPDPTVPFGVLYEDASLIVVDKPAGVVVHPGRGHWHGTLIAGLLARAGFERLPLDPLDPEAKLRPGMVHRIDKDTSGLLVVAKTEPAREGLKEQLSRHDVERVYRGITQGVPSGAKIETRHARHERYRRRFTSLVEEGRVAVTHVRVDETLAAGRAALVSCRLETGRTHQIRVHLAEQTRTPLLADALYGQLPGDASLRAVAVALGRQALHAQVLGFRHPLTGEWMRFESPLPEDMARALEALRELPAR